MGRVKPTIGLVVAPTIVIASPIFGITTANKHVIATSTKVHTKFSFCVIDLVYPSSNSSTVSLHGSMHKGVAKIMPVRSKNCASIIQMFPSYGAFRMF